MMSFEKMLVQTKLTNEAIDGFTNASRVHYGSDSYAAGYLGSMLVQALNELPKHRRAEFRQVLAQQTAILNERILAK